MRYETADQLRFERLVAEALPATGAAPVGGWMLLRRPSVAPPFVVHVKPVIVPQPDYGARPVAALVLIVDPRGYHRVDPRVVAKTLDLTPAESQVAAWLAEGRSVREMAEATGRTQHAIYWHLKQIYQKRSISRQADLVRLVAVARRTRVKLPGLKRKVHRHGGVAGPFLAPPVHSLHGGRPLLAHRIPRPFSPSRGVKRFALNGESHDFAEEKSGEPPRDSNPEPAD